MGRAGETDRSVHTSLYRPARLPLTHFGLTTNYTVSPAYRIPNKRRFSVIIYLKLLKLYFQKQSM